MKKYLHFIVIFIAACSLLAACVPEDPKDILPFCKELYKDVLLEYPEMPKAFIGYCVATLQTGDVKAYQGLCAHEAFWEIVGVDSRIECFQYFEDLE